MSNTITSTTDRIIRPKELATILGVCTETIRLWRKGKGKGIENFPKPIQIGARAIGWLESEIDSYIEARRAVQVNNQQNTPDNSISYLTSINFH